jgi:hypothetical protein
VATTPPPLPELRVRTPGELLDASVKVWGANIKKLAIITAALTLPFEMLGALALIHLKPTILDEVKRVQDLTAKGVKARLKVTPGMGIGAGANFALGSLGTVLVIVAVTYVVAALYTDPGKSPRSDAEPLPVIRQVLRRAHVIYAVHLTSLAIAVLVWIAVAVPLGVAGELVKLSALRFSAGIAGLVGLWLAVLTFRVAMPAIANESTGVLTTLRRGVSLGKTHRRTIVGAWLTFLIATVIPNALISGMTNSILNGLGGDNRAFDFVWLGLARTLADAFCAPIAAIGVFFVYVNLRLLAGETPL